MFKIIVGRKKDYKKIQYLEEKNQRQIKDQSLAISAIVAFLFSASRSFLQVCAYMID